VFYGESNHAMDKKGRVFLPKRFQEALTRDASGNLCGVLTFGFEGCLCIYSQEGFDALAAAQNTETFTTPAARQAQRRFFRRTHPFTLDGSGRLVLPERYREFAGLELGSEVVMMGVSKRAEVWSPSRLEQLDGDDDFDTLGHGFGPVGGSTQDDQPGAGS
jgi:MraZ protein